LLSLPSATGADVFWLVTREAGKAEANVLGLPTQEARKAAAS
jgi:hypothetical protein